MLNTLVLHTNVPCLLFLGQNPLGETGESLYLPLPVDSEGAYYVWALPLEPGYSPTARKLSFSSDMPTAEGLRVIAWQRGIFEVKLTLEKLPFSSRYTPGAVCSHTFEFGMTATLFISEAGGLHLCVEKSGAPVYACYVGEAGPGRLEEVLMDDCALLFVFCEKHCLCLKLTGEVTCTMTLHADRFYRRKHQIVSLSALDTAGKYERRTLHDGKTGECLSDEVGYFSAAKVQPLPADPCTAALRLFEAAQYGVEKDVQLLAGGELEGISAEQLRQFLGTFARCRLAPIQSENGCVIGTLESDGFCRAVCFLVTLEQSGESYKVTNIEPL